MARIGKQISTLILAICLVLSMIVPTIYAKEAKEIVYNFNFYGIVDALGLGVRGNSLEAGACASQLNDINQEYPDAINWNFHSLDFDNSAETNSYTARPAFQPAGFFRGRTKIGNWVAFTIENPGSGIWSVSMEHPICKTGAAVVNVHILPADADVATAVAAKNYCVGTYNCYDSTVTDKANKSLTTLVGNWTAEAGQDYILVFEAAEKGNSKSADSAFIYFSKLIMKEGAAVIVDPVDGEVVADNIVPNYIPQVIASSEVNGHDYVYIVSEGSVLFVYDLDTGKLIDQEKLSFSTTRGIYVDENGLVWLSGSSCRIFCYDPVSLTCQLYEFPSKTFPDITSYEGYGITGDGNGNIYFALYNRGYFMKFNSKTKEFTSLTNSMLRDYAMYAGRGGVVLRNGYAYMCVDGNLGVEGGIQRHELLKFDLSTNKVVAALDISRIFGSILYLDSLSLMGDTLIACVGNKYVAVNADTMEEVSVDFVENGFYGSITKEYNGKIYMMEYGKSSDGGRGLLEYDVHTGTVKTTDCQFTVNYLEDRDCFVTVNGMPGVSLVTYMAYEDRIDLIVYNPESGQTKVITDVTDGRGSGARLRALEISPDGKSVYVGAYGNNHISVYNIDSKTVTDNFASYSYQTSGLKWYNGKLYVGNYSSCTITQVDPETQKATPMSRHAYAPFLQQRANTLVAGDDMVFLGTAPSKARNGGLLVWYHTTEERVYTATGPNPEDVFYTSAGILTDAGTVIKGDDTVWYNAKTGEIADFDLDNDGTNDSFITVGGESVQFFTGVITNQTINAMVYQDGYIYGSTSLAGGSGAPAVEGNACLFVYDVEAMKVVATYDLSDAIEGLAQPVQFVDALAADPDVQGKIWGTVSDTLFTFTFDHETKEFDVKIELSFGTENYKNGMNTYKSRDIIMDGEFMYVVFGSYGTYMVNREDPQIHYQLSTVVPKEMKLGADGNLYYYSGTETDLMMLPIAEAAQMVKAPFEIESTQVLIDALDDAVNITLEDEAAVIAARKAYDRLTSDGKAAVDATKLIAAEEVIKPLRAAADQAAAEAVTAQIAAIGTVTLESEGAIVAARKAYDALSVSQKKLVTNLDTLTAAEEQLELVKITPEDIKAAADVDALINGIGTITMNSQDAIIAARTAYNTLTAKQKTLVTNLSVLTKAEEAMAALLAENQKVYDFDYVNSGLNFSGNSWYESKTRAYIDEYYKNGVLNWNLKDISFTSTLSNDITFNGIGYLQGRSVEGDWFAFSMKTPGSGIWSVSANYLATFCGAEEVSIYILPADTENIGTALTEENRVGIFNCYDPQNKNEKPALSALKSDTLAFWTAGDMQEYIMVVECTKANADAVADSAAREEADPENTRDYGSNIYLAQVIFNKSDDSVLAVQHAIEAIGTVTLDSEKAIADARSAYNALGMYYQAQITNLAVLDAAEEALAEIKKEVSENPKTGEVVFLEVFAGVLLTSAAVMSAVLLSDNKRKRI